MRTESQAGNINLIYLRTFPRITIFDSISKNPKNHIPVLKKRKRGQNQNAFKSQMRNAK